MNTIKKFINRYEIKHGEIPTVEEISKEVDIPVEKIQEIMDQSKRQLSLNDSATGDEKNSLMDFIVNEKQELPDQSVLTESRHEDIQSVLSTLTDREAEIVRLYYGINFERAFTLEEIGEKYNLTRERVRQIKEMALNKLKHKSRSQTLRTYLT